MFKSIVLQNFQSHKDTTLEFDPGVNVIIGDSDSGKTAILRALTWVLTNRPTGEAFRRYGTSETRVKVETIEGSVERLRADNGNLYWVGVERLAAIGTSVPESVLKLLKMDPEVNIQRQLDAPFLLSCSPGEVAQRLNASVGLDEIDVGLVNVARRVRQGQLIFEQAETECAAVSKLVDSFAYLTEMEQAVSQLEQQSRDLDIMELQIARLTDILGEVQQSQLEMDSLPAVDMLLLLLRTAQEQLQNYNKVYEQCQKLSVLIKDVAKANKTLDDMPDMIGLLRIVSGVEYNLERLGEYTKSKQGMESTLVSYSEISQNLRSVTETLTERERRLRKEFPLICPLCGRKGK
jgi:DNA repair ATPase RecN